MSYVYNLILNPVIIERIIPLFHTHDIHGYMYHKSDFK